MRSFKLTIAYDGTAYQGWQSQPDRPTIQGSLERAFAKITGEEVRITGSGRTDAGVHALGQVASLESATHLAPDVLQRALNHELPADIVVVRLDEAAPGFHAIRDCTGKRYRYVLHDGPVPDLFRRLYCWHYRQRLDDAAMHRAAQGLHGTHDFRSFESQWPNRTTSVRTIREIAVVRQPAENGDYLYVEVEADGFLYNMVRSIVGTLVEVGRGAQSEAWPAEVVAAMDRSAAGRTAPAQGLFLMRVDYAE
ncbi:MAG: tRNA pseudouridine(38-40) synthase TruA [Pirellulales bacterium]|nr:tRNA pseudouridine(38-40) synthase TruA [Pirellulales bacterium]